MELINVLHLLLSQRTLSLQDIMTNPTFKLGINHLLSTNQYVNIGTPFNELLDLKRIIAKMNSKINYTVNYFFGLLTNRNIPFYFKNSYSSFLLSLVQFFTFAYLLESNKKYNCMIIQFTGEY